MIALFLAAQADLPRPPMFVPPKTQTLICSVVNSHFKRFSIKLESKWVESVGDTRLQVIKDETNSFPSGLPLLGSIYDSTRKSGLPRNWKNDLRILRQSNGPLEYELTLSRNGWDSAKQDRGLATIQLVALPRSSDGKAIVGGRNQFVGFCEVIPSGQIADENGPGPK